MCLLLLSLLLTTLQGRYSHFTAEEMDSERFNGLEADRILTLCCLVATLLLFLSHQTMLILLPYLLPCTTGHPHLTPLGNVWCRQT